jgi:NADH-ubiquinone oxidoreductase chain 1
MIIIFFNYFFIVLGVLIRVAFIVLFERKVLRYIQIRKGPNKVGFIGILQSFGDAIKLFIKEQTIPFNSNFFLYYFSPVISLFIIIYLWVVFPVNRFYMYVLLGGLLFFCCTGIGVYTLITRGWSSNRNYALLGALRGVAQTISYEVSLALIFVSFIFIIRSFNFGYFVKYQIFIINFIVFFPLFLCWVRSRLAETNRTPFDFAEGESELVSGFNIEYGRGGFALLFLAEYGRIIFIRYLISLMFFGIDFIYLVSVSFLGCFFCFWFIWMRGTLPRFRYDKLMYLAWKRFLPISLNLILFFIY